MREWIQHHPLIAILRGVPPKQAVDYAGAVLRGGIGAVEVALNSPDALRQIARIREAYDGRLAVGAGTVLTAAQARDALSAGADFLLSPSAGQEVLGFCAGRGVRFLPGVMTPSDVALCLSYGFDLLKLFPAGDLPLHYLKSLKGPFDGTDYVAVGGVTRENLRAFLDAGYLGAGIGGGLIPKELVKAGDWEGAAQAVHAFSDQLSPGKDGLA